MATRPKEAPQGKVRKAPAEVRRAIVRAWVSDIVVDGGRTRVRGLPRSPHFARPDPPQAVVKDIESIYKSPLRYPTYMFVPLSGLLEGAFADKGYDAAQAGALAARFARLCEAHQIMSVPAEYVSGPDTRGQEFVAELVASVAAILPPTHAFNAANGPELRLPPDNEIEKYADRADRRETSLAFLDRVWGPFIRAGIAFQPEVNRVDPGLLPKVRAYCSRRKIDPSTVLPPPSYRKHRVFLPKLSAAQLQAAHYEYVRSREAERRAQRRASV